MTAASTVHTLETLAARLDALERANASLVHENYDLRAEVARLATTSQSLPASNDDHPHASSVVVMEGAGSVGPSVSRRGVLGTGLKLVAGALGAGMILVREAEPVSADSVNGMSTFNAYCEPGLTCYANQPVVNAIGDGSHPGLYAQSSYRQAIEAKGNGAAIGVLAQSASGYAIKATTNTTGQGSGKATIESLNQGNGPALRANSTGGDGVHAFAGGAVLSFPPGVAAVHAEGGSGFGVFAQNSGQLPAIEGNSLNWDGIYGQGRINGVVGRTSNADASAVYGQNDDGGFGVAGDTSSAASTDPAIVRAAVFGRNSGTGPGVHGWSLNNDGDGVLGTGQVGVNGTSASGTGVQGEGTIGVLGSTSAASGSALLGEASGSASGVRATSQQGYGAVLSGGKAQMRLLPRGTVGKPTTGTHAVGELYLDRVGSLFICTVAGTPSTWKTVTVS